MMLSLSNTTAREMWQRTRERVKPWGDFLDTKRFQLPTSPAPVPRRVMANMVAFHGNYLSICLGLFLFCVLTSPMLLVAIGICLGACYFITSRGPDQPLSIMGHEMTVKQQYGAVGVLSFPLFWLAGAGSAVFWVIGASFFVVMLHAATYGNLEGHGNFDPEMDSVESMA